MVFPVNWGSYNSHKSWNTLPVNKDYLALRVYKLWLIQTQNSTKNDKKTLKVIFNKIKTLNGGKEYITWLKGVSFHNTLHDWRGSHSTIDYMTEGGLIPQYITWLKGVSFHNTLHDWRGLIPQYTEANNPHLMKDWAKSEPTCQPCVLSKVCYNQSLKVRTEQRHHKRTRSWTSRLHCMSSTSLPWTSTT